MRIFGFEITKDKKDEQLEIPSFLRNADDHDKEDKVNGEDRNVDIETSAG